MTPSDLDQVGGVVVVVVDVDVAFGVCVWRGGQCWAAKLAVGVRRRWPVVAGRSRVRSSCRVSQSKQKVKGGALES